MPLRVEPEGNGDVIAQTVALVEDHVYMYESPSVIVTGPSEPLALISAETVTGEGGGGGGGGGVLAS